MYQVSKDSSEMTHACLFINQKGVSKAKKKKKKAIKPLTTHSSWSGAEGEHT